MNGFSKTYLNIILTAIAVLLLVVVLQRPSSVGIATDAAAQDRLVQRPEYERVDIATRSTLEVAQANKEIAKEVGNVADALRQVAKAIEAVAMAQRQSN